MEKGKQLTKEELENVGGGRIIADKWCELCGRAYDYLVIDGRTRFVCTNPECPNHTPNKIMA